MRLYLIVKRKYKIFKALNGYREYLIDINNGLALFTVYKREINKRINNINQSMNENIDDEIFKLNETKDLLISKEKDFLSKSLIAIESYNKTLDYLETNNPDLLDTIDLRRKIDDYYIDMKIDYIHEEMDKIIKNKPNLIKIMFS